MSAYLHGVPRPRESEPQTRRYSQCRFVEGSVVPRSDEGLYGVRDSGSYLSFNEMANPDLGHDGDRYSVHDGFDHLWVTLPDLRQWDEYSRLGRSRTIRETPP